MHRCRYAVALIPAACALTLSALPLAMAQTTPSTAAEEKKAESDVKSSPQTIVVTANKRRQAAHRVPMNVSAIGEEQLREENITDLKKLIANSPAIDAPANSARFADSVTVRGLNVSSASANNIEWFTRSTLSYYLDDAPLPNIGYRIKDIERVETLLGPQGTLYGGSSLAGTVRYITNQPQFGKVEGRVSTSIYQTKYGGVSNDTDGVVNLPAGNDFALRVVAARLDEKGYTDRYSGVPPNAVLPGRPWTPKPNPNQAVYEDDDWQKVNTGRVSARWRLAPDVILSLSHAQQSQLANGTSGAQLISATGNPDRYNAPLAINDHTILAPYEEFADRDFRMTTFDLDWNLSIGRLHSSTSTYKDTRIGQADYLATGWFFYGDLGYDRYNLSLPAFDGNTAYLLFDSAYKGTVHETRLVSNPGGAVDWITGLYYATQEKSLKYTENLPTLPTSGPAGVGYFEDQSSKYKETALFGELSVKPAPGATLTAGARLFSYEDDTTTQVEDYAFELVSGVVRAGDKGSRRAYFKFNASFDLTPDLLGYVTFSQGFRRGGANGFRPEGGVQPSQAALFYKPDTTDSFEIGLKGYFADRRGYIQASVYDILWKNAQTYLSQDIQGFPVWGTTNGPNANSQGFELEGRYNFTDSIRVEAATSYSTAAWVGTKTVCLYANNTECRTYNEGGALGGAPKKKHMLGVRWDSNLASGASLNASLRARYTGPKASDRADAPGENVFTFKGYTLLNAGVGWSNDTWDVSLWAENLSDKRALASFQGTSAVASRIGLRAMYVKPRTIGLNVSYHFK